MTQKKSVTINVNELIKYFTLLATFVGAVVTFGNQFWASKDSVHKIETKIEVMAEQIKFIHKAFEEAAKHSEH